MVGATAVEGTGSVSSLVVVDDPGAGTVGAVGCGAIVSTVSWPILVLGPARVVGANVVVVDAVVSTVDSVVSLAVDVVCSPGGDAGACVVVDCSSTKGRLSGAEPGPLTANQIANMAAIRSADTPVRILIDCV